MSNVTLVTSWQVEIRKKSVPKKIYWDKWNCGTIRVQDNVHTDRQRINNINCKFYKMYVLLYLILCPREVEMLFNIKVFSVSVGAGARARVTNILRS